MEIARYSGLFDELEKISEVRRKDATKEIFKRHLKTLAPVFLGAGLATGTGYAVRDALLRRSGKLSELARRYPAIKKYAPVAAGALGGAAGYVGGLRRKAIRDYIEKGDDGPK